MPLRFRRLAAVVAALPTCACVAYEPRPLDLDAARADLFSRDAGAASVAAFAVRLRAAGDGPAHFDPSDGLGAAEAEVVALFFNPALRRARRAAGVAVAGAAEAGLWQDPELGVDGEKITESVDDPWVLGGTVDLTLPLSGRLDAERGRAAAEARAAAADVRAEEWRVRIHVRRLAAEGAATALRAEVLRAHVARINEAAEATTRLEAAGEITRPEARLFALERASAVAERNAVLAEGAATRAALLSACGLAPEAPQVFAAAFSDGPPAGEAATRRREAEARNPVLAAARTAYDVAEEDLRLETRRQYPDLAASLGFGVDEGVARVLFGGGLPLPVWNANRRGVAEADARRSAAEAAVVDAFEATQHALAAAEARRAAAVALREELETVVAPLVDAQMADVAAAARLGRFEPLLLLETLGRLRDAQLRLVAARLEEALATIALEESVGPPAVLAATAEEPRR